MTRTKIDTQGLHAALNAERTARDWSWRQLAKEIGVSPSLLSRLANELRPDADGFATLVRWLNMPAEQFMIDANEKRSTQTEPDLAAQLTPLLRAHQDLDKQDIDYLQKVIQATVQHARLRGKDLSD